MLIVALFINSTTKKQPECSSTGQWINMWWYTHTMESYLVMKKKELLIPIMAWMDLKCILLSGRSQTQKATYLYDSICVTPWKRRHCRDGEQMLGIGGGRQGLTTKRAPRGIFRVIALCCMILGWWINDCLCQNL